MTKGRVLVTGAGGFVGSDVAVADLWTGEVAVLLGDGSGAVGAPTAFPAGDGTTELASDSSAPHEVRWDPARGEIDELADPGEAAEAFAATFFFRALMTGQPLDEAFVARHVDRVIASVTD